MDFKNKMIKYFPQHGLEFEAEAIDQINGLSLHENTFDVVAMPDLHVG